MDVVHRLHDHHAALREVDAEARQKIRAVSLGAARFETGIIRSLDGQTYARGLAGAAFLLRTEFLTPMAGRLMREYVVVPQGLVEEKAKLKQWIEWSLAYVAGLPAKARKPQAR